MPQETPTPSPPLRVAVVGTGNVGAVLRSMIDDLSPGTDGARSG